MSSRRETVFRLVAALAVGATAFSGLVAPTATAQEAAARARRREQRRTDAPRQTRPHGRRVPVDPAGVVVDDGDTLVIRWPDGERETVRLLGIDAPETRHREHEIPLAQPFGPEARAFAQGAFAAATHVELMRAATLDSYGRTLGYVFLNGRNYSVLAASAGLGAETVTHYGDNGFPAEAAAVLAAARTAGPPRFERPHVFRARMRELNRFLRDHGIDAER